MLLVAAQLAVGFVLFSPWGRAESLDGVTDPYISRTGAKRWAGPASFNLYESVFLWGMPEDALPQECARKGSNLGLAVPDRSSVRALAWVVAWAAAWTTTRAAL